MLIHGLLLEVPAETLAQCFHDVGARHEQAAREALSTSQGIENENVRHHREDAERMTFCGNHVVPNASYLLRPHQLPRFSNGVPMAFSGEMLPLED